MITIDAHQLYCILDHTPADQNILLVGKHGIGKSQILKEYYRAQGKRVVTLFLGQMADPGDLIGMPDRRGDKTVFLAPNWWPEDGEEVVLFLDELNRARAELLQTVMDLCLSRRLVGRVLPAGSRIIAAVNEGDEYQLTPLDPALVSRFNVYEFRPTVADWLLYARTSALDERVVGFLEENSGWLDGIPGDMQQDHGLEPLPNRRSWTRVAQLVSAYPMLSENELPLLAGVVGTAAATAWMAYITGRQHVSGMQILQDYPQYEAAIRRYPIHLLSLINEGIFQHLEICSSLDTGALAEEMIARYAGHLTAYVQLLQSTDDREALAHMANLFASCQYEKAVAFIMQYAPEVYTTLVDYVSHL